MHTVLMIVGMLLVILGFIMILYNLTFTEVVAEVLRYEDCDDGYCHPVYRFKYDDVRYEFQSRFWVKQRSHSPSSSSSPTSLRHRIKVNRFFPTVQRDEGFELLVYLLAMLFIMIGIITLVVSFISNEQPVNSGSQRSFFSRFPLFRVKNEPTV